jgi:hypothetical protein
MAKKKPSFNLDPDQIFLDSRPLPEFSRGQLEGVIEKPITRNTFIALGIVVSLLGVLFSTRVFFLQVVRGEDFALRSEENSLAHQSIPAPRGVIYDRVGEELAWNVEGERAYTSRNGFGHVLGFTGLPNEKEAKNFLPNEIIGKEGIEESLQSALAGVDGKKIIEETVSGKIAGQSVLIPPVAGKPVSLSIDARVNEALYNAIAGVAEDRGFQGGAGVVMNVKTGELLAMVNYPEYKSEVLSTGADRATIQSYQNDPHKPFLNRVVQGVYTPGSIIKPYIAIGALEEGTIDPAKKILSTGSISIQNPYDPTLKSVFRDWKAHGWVDMRRAISAFALFSPEEVRARRDAVRSRLIAAEEPVTESRISQRTSVGAGDIAQRMRLYQVSDFAPQHEGESAKAYADRIAKLSDARLASKTTREFFQHYGIGLHHLPWSEQLAASSILIDPRINKKEVGKFCEEYGLDGLRTFISSTYGENINRDILTLGAKAPELARTTFAKYHEILSGIDAIDQSLRQLNTITNLDTQSREETIRSIREKLLRRAKQVLSEVSSIVSQSKKVSSKTILSLSEALHESQSDIELFKATFKTLKEHETEITLDDFQENTVASESSSEIIAEDAAHTRALYADSMRGYPAETKERLLAEFDSHMQDEKSRFTTLRHKGKIVGSLCFTETAPGQKYVSAVTLDPRFQKAFIGEAMIDEAFKQEAAQNILGADCVAQKSVSARYIEQGFIGVRSWDDKGDLILDIVRDDRRNERYFKTKAMTQEEIVKLAPLGKIGSAKVEVVSNPQEHSFARCNEGFVLTRYFKDTQTKKWYLVYEPMPMSPQAKKAQRSTEAATA